jgi:hypothetical protein
MLEKVYKKGPKIYTEVTLIRGYTRSLVVPAKMLENFLGFEPTYSEIYISRADFILEVKFYARRQSHLFKIIKRPGYYQLVIAPGLKLLGLSPMIEKKHIPTVSWSDEEKTLRVDLKFLAEQKKDE